MKIQKVIFSILITLSLITGCKKNPKEQHSEINFIPSLDTQRVEEFYIVSDMKNFEALETVIYEFNKFYPHVNIIYEYLGNYVNMIEKRLKNDSSVACFTSTGPAGIDLVPFNFNTSAFGPIIESTRNEGRLQGIPIGMDILGLMVNKTLLDKEGIKIPKNKAEFRESCKVLVDKGYIPIQQNVIKGSRYMFTSFVYSEMLKLGDSKKLVSELTSGKPECTEVLRPICNIVDEDFHLGYFSTEKNRFVSDEYEAAILNFFKGDVPFLPVSSDTISGMRKRESKSPDFMKSPFEYHFIYVPLGDDGIIATQNCWRSMCVSDYTDHMEMAVEFLRFLGTVDMLNLLAQIKGMPSASKVQNDIRFLAMNNAKGEYIYLWDREIPFKVYNTITNRLGEFCNGNYASIDDVLELLVEDLRE